MQASSVPTVCCCLVLVSVLVNCKRAQTTNTIVVRVTSPDGKFSALLVDRYYHAARVSDEFFLIVIPGDQNERQAVNARDIGDASALVTTRATKLQLRWQSNDTLLVICDWCGLKAIDISKKIDRIGSVKIIYQGFPEHTAYR